MKALIDGDILVYRCAFAAEHTIYHLIDKESGIPIAVGFESAAAYKTFVKETELSEFVVEKEREVEPLSHALANIKSVMATILEGVSADEYTVFLSKGKCFRHGIATIKKYKGNRDDAPRPVYYNEVRDFLIKNYGAVVVESIEADDALALSQNHPNTCIVSIDKDLLQVPGYHFNWVKEEKVYITPEVGEKKLYMQVLTGDSTDNIPGIKGIGPVKARKLLDGIKPEELGTSCVSAWEDYLQREPEGFEADCEKGRYLYSTWDAKDGEQVTASPRDVAEEVYRLVKVGGHDAREALQSSGEEVLLAC